MRTRNIYDDTTFPGHRFWNIPKTYFYEETKKPEDIDFDAEKQNGMDIIVLAHQPGVGKTYHVKKYIQTHPNSVYFTKHHETIEEILNDFEEPQTHWKGFQRTCSISNFKNLEEAGLPISIACKLCHKDERECKYWTNLRGNLPIFSPFEFLATRFKERLDEDEFNPRVIFLDESKLEVNIFKYEPKKVKEWLEILGYTQEAEFALNPQEYFRELLDLLKSITERYNSAIEKAYNNDDIKLLKKIVKIKPYNIKKYLHEAIHYNDFNREFYSTPLWYHAFDLIDKNILLVILDANFNKYWFNVLLEFYDGEKGFRQNSIKTKIYYSDWKAKDENDKHVTKFYNMRYMPLGGCYYKSTIKSGIEWLASHLQKIIDIYGEKNIGLITYKEVANILKSFGVTNIQMEHFGFLRGKNTLEDKKVLIIVGTYQIAEKDLRKHLKEIFYIYNPKIIEYKEQIVKEYIRIYGKGQYIEDIKEGKIEPIDKLLMMMNRREFRDEYFIEREKTSFRNGSPSNIDRNSVYPVTWVFKATCDDEIYQAYHRNRGLRHPRIIFSYGWFPRELGYEYMIQSVPINKADEDAFWEKLLREEKKSPESIQRRKEMKRLFELAEELIEEKGLTLDDIIKKERSGITTPIAKEFGLWEKEEREWLKEMIVNYLRVRMEVDINKKK